MKYSKKMLRAFEDTIYAYEKSIADLENGVDEEIVRMRWESYGSFCGLCRAAGVDTSFGPNCRNCVLDGRENDEGMPCVAFGMADTYNNLHDAILGDMALLAPLKSRLRAIVKRADKNGIVLEEAP